jgi:hypothetical protein
VDPVVVVLTVVRDMLVTPRLRHQFRDIKEEMENLSKRRVVAVVLVVLVVMEPLTEVTEAQDCPQV